MNQAPTPENDQSRGRRFVLEMLGFTEAEKEMLASTFRLTGRRAFSYAEASTPEERSDVYLVNADNAAALNQLQTRCPNIHAPAVLIGSVAAASPWPVIDKPIRWMRLFEQLDKVMEAAVTERVRRRSTTSDKWDGRTYRRSVDRNAAAKPVYVEPKPMETVLVVDDSATVRAFMRAKLAPFRFDVDYAENGEKAIDMAQAKKYTCIFLDIMMPGIDGYQVCKSIRSNPDSRDTAVVMLTSKTSAIDKFRGNWAGCDTYLSKPVSEDDLLMTIARYLPSARKKAQAILTSPS
jgi:two-component system cell cycle response regulator